MYSCLVGTPCGGMDVLCPYPSYLHIYTIHRHHTPPHQGPVQGVLPNPPPQDVQPGVRGAYVPACVRVDLTWPFLPFFISLPHDARLVRAPGPRWLTTNPPQNHSHTTTITHRCSSPPPKRGRAPRGCCTSTRTPSTTGRSSSSSASSSASPVRFGFLVFLFLHLYACMCA